MAPHVKKSTLGTRVTEKEKEDYGKAALGLGWSDPSALTYAFITMINTGVLEIKPPAKQSPIVNFKDK